MDLNLLYVLDALLGERNVTRAAAKVGLSQPAFSHALRRLRLQVGDELFVRTRYGVRPTARALDIASAVRPALEQLQRALVNSPGSQREISGSVTIGLDGYLQAFVLPRLARGIERLCPGIFLEVQDVSSGIVPLLRDGRLDLAVCAGEVGERREIRQTTLFEDRLVCLARKGLVGDAAQLSEELDAVLNHVAVGPSAGVKRFRTDGKETGRVSVTTPGLLSVPWLVAASDAVALVPARLGRWFAERLPLDVLEPPVPQRASYRLVWHRRVEQQAATRWVIQHVRETAQHLEDSLN